MAPFSFFAFYMCASSFAFSDQSLSPEAVKLKQAYAEAVEKAVEKATSPLRERYVADLKRLMEKSLDEALALKAEINSVPLAVTDIGSRLIGTKWNWNNDYPFVLQFQADGKGSGSDGSFKWRVVKPWQLEYTFKNGNHGTIDFQQDLVKAEILEIYPNGQKADIPLLRITP